MSAQANSQPLVRIMGRGGFPGRKAQNLHDLHPLIEKAYFLCQNQADHYPIDLFRQFAKMNHIPLETRIVEDGWFSELELPTDLMEALAQTLARFPDTPLAVRSSEQKECGGTGIFRTTFYVPPEKAGTELGALANAVLQVYGSWWKDGLAYRTKHESSGMGLRIEPVIGERTSGHIFPIAAGTAFTHYGSGEECPLIFRTVPGFGTAAVRGEGELAEIGPDAFFEFGFHLREKDIGPIEYFDGLSLKTGMVERLPFTGEFVDGFFAVNYEELIDALSILREKGRFYLEWAVKVPSNHLATAGRLMTDEQAVFEMLENGGPSFYVTQIAEIEKSRTFAPIAIPDRAKTIEIARGTDCLGEGRKECRGIVFFDIYWSLRSKKAAELIAHLLEDYLLIVPPAAISVGGGVARLGYAEICNAGGVLDAKLVAKDKYQDANFGVLREQGFIVVALGHSELAATHFEGICRQEKILFLHAWADIRALVAEGEAVQIPLNSVSLGEYGTNIDNVVPKSAQVIIINRRAIIECKEGNGSVSIVEGGEPPLSEADIERIRMVLGAEVDRSEFHKEIQEYTPYTCNAISQAIRIGTYQLNETDSEAADLLYDIHYSMPTDMPETGKFDPFALNIEDDMVVTRETVKRALELAPRFPKWETDGVTRYLELLLERMKE